MTLRALHPLKGAGLLLLKLSVYDILTMYEQLYKKYMKEGADT